MRGKIYESGIKTVKNNDKVNILRNCTKKLHYTKFSSITYGQLKTTCIMLKIIEIHYSNFSKISILSKELYLNKK